jgi:hypothetical protein
MEPAAARRRIICRNAFACVARAEFRGEKRGGPMASFFLWCILLVLCWPLALVALILYPIVWLLLLPFRLVGITIRGVFELLRAMIMLPARILRGPARA